VANLDPKARLDFFNHLLRLKERGKAIFVSSHVLAELDRYFDSATILDGGKIVFTGTSTELSKMFNDCSYEIDTNKNDEVINYLNKLGFKYIISPQTNVIKFTVNSVDDIPPIQK
jgi:ABC-2 type transport system ATP-binding protein